MNKCLLKKYLLLFLLLSLLVCSLGGCYNTQNIDNLGYVVALGLDIGDNQNLKLSFQLSIPSSSNGGSSQSSESVINSVNCSTIESGISLFNSYVSKEITLSHCRVIVISEQLAKSGISNYLYTLINSIQIPAEANLIISKCSAEYFLDNSKPVLEKFSAKYYETAPSSSKYTGYTDDITLGQFFSDYTDTFKEPCAILGAVNTSSSQDPFSNANSSNGNPDGNYTAGNTPIQSQSNIENMGLAVFSDDKLVGELTGMETLCQLILQSKMQSCTITIPSPFQTDQTIDLKLRLIQNTKNKVDIISGAPFIHSSIQVEARILSMDEHSENLDEQSIKKIEQYTNLYLKDIISNFLYKTAKDFKTDTVGFGKHAVIYFATWDQWQDYNWLHQYRNAFFDVEVDTSVKSGYLLMET